MFLCHFHLFRFTRLCPSTVECSPPSIPSTVPCLLLTCTRVVPSFFAMSSCHLLLGRPLGLFPLLAYHSVHRLAHKARFPTQCSCVSLSAKQWKVAFIIFYEPVVPSYHLHELYKTSGFGKYRLKTDELRQLVIAFCISRLERGEIESSP